MQLPAVSHAVSLSNIHHVIIIVITSVSISLVAGAVRPAVILRVVSLLSESSSRNSLDVSRAKFTYMYTRGDRLRSKMFID